MNVRVSNIRRHSVEVVIIVQCLKYLELETEIKCLKEEGTNVSRKRELMIIDYETKINQRNNNGIRQSLQMTRL